MSFSPLSEQAYAQGVLPVDLFEDVTLKMVLQKMYSRREVGALILDHYDKNSHELPDQLFMNFLIEVCQNDWCGDFKK